MLSLKHCLIWSVQTLVDLNHFEVTYVQNLPDIVKEDVLNLALRNGKAQKCISNFLHPNIKNLHINESTISNDDLHNISRCKKIRSLQMNPPTQHQYNHCSLALKQLFTSLPQLVKLHVQRNQGVTDDVLAALTTHCPLLQELDVSGCHTLSDRSAVSLATLHNLQSANLSSTSIGDESLLAMADGVCSQTLTEVILNNCVNITDKSLNVLINKCCNLSILACGNCPKVSGDNHLGPGSDLGKNKKKQVTWTFYF
ncbi:protein AMN1 homolog isoform X2 [Homalodisca vitripennis]|uniref:protein AMN1 homolog isoform X2 n=1 Tax=Homalodisca vitripennis TaxID=197043 RepID=UPI001EEB4014|nr:protein AMN1 homolog isoform X2 [Homalodisca vitripennis]